MIVEEPSSEPKETKPANIVALKTGAAALRDQIVQVQFFFAVIHIMFYWLEVPVVALEIKKTNEKNFELKKII